MDLKNTEIDFIIFSGSILTGVLYLVMDDSLSFFQRTDGRRTEKLGLLSLIVDLHRIDSGNSPKQQ